MTEWQPIVIGFLFGWSVVGQLWIGWRLRVHRRWIEDLTEAFDRRWEP